MSEMVSTPMGEEPFERAVRWHVPTMLRWLAMNRDTDWMPDGSLPGELLRCAADMIESAVWPCKIGVLPRVVYERSTEDAAWLMPDLGEAVEKYSSPASDQLKEIDRMSAEQVLRELRAVEILSKAEPSEK